MPSSRPRSSLLIIGLTLAFLSLAAVPAARFTNLHLGGSDNRLTGAGGKLTADAGTTVDLAAATVLLPGGSGGGASLPSTSGRTVGDVLTIASLGPPVTFAWATPAAAGGGGGGGGAAALITGLTGYSSSVYSGYGPEKLVDGDVTTNNYVPDGGLTKFAGVQMPASHTLTLFEVYPEPTLRATLAGAIIEASAAQGGTYVTLGNLPSDVPAETWTAVTLSNTTAWTVVRVRPVVDGALAIKEIRVTGY